MTNFAIRQLFLYALVASMFSADSDIITGTLALKLADHYAVTVQKFNEIPFISANGKMGTVKYPNGITIDSGFRMENETVPGNDGIVIKIYNRITGGEQKDWSNTTDGLEMERVLTLRSREKYGVIISCGKDFDRKIIHEILRAFDGT